MTSQAVILRVCFLVEGRGSRLASRGSRVTSQESRVISRGSKNPSQLFIAMFTCVSGACFIKIIIFFYSNIILIGGK